MVRARRVVVVGFDGLEPRIFERLLAGSELPAFMKVRVAGGYSRVATTLPAQTPVAWSTFATGTNPGGHGIYDFIRRDPQTYLADFSLNRFEQKNMFLPPRAVNLRRGEPVWEVLSKAGIPSAVLRCPCSFPPDDLKGHMLSGMGVPDLRGGLGTPAFYTSDPAARRGESEHLIPVQVAGDTLRTRLIGPRHPKTRADLEQPMTVRIDRGGRSVLVAVDGTDGETAATVGRWTDWVKLRFKVGLLQSMTGMVRFLLVRLDPHLELYVSPVNFDPSATLLYPIASPAEYARELAEQIGMYYTTGMVEDHGGLNNGRFGEDAYLAQCADVMAERERMLQHELARQRDGFVFCLFDTPDRVQHMFWRFLERDHPAQRAAPVEGFDDAIEQHYRACDAILGRVLDAAGDDTLVITLSDHGFTSFRRGVHLNAWLRREGLLALKPGVEPGEEAGEYLRSVDWTRTKAYAVGIGSLYLNLRGREGEGTVSAEEAPALSQRIADGLTGLTDSATGEAAIRGVTDRSAAYAGPFAAESPDLVVRFAEGYRASWTTAVGGVPEDLFEDNIKRWSGDHIVDPALVPGVLLMNRPFRGECARLVDLAPTILAALGAPRGPAMEGEELLS
jgi:predicted AlkP superfamily phosphohydrolase/phosphomutase